MLDIGMTFYFFKIFLNSIRFSYLHVKHTYQMFSTLLSRAFALKPFNGGFLTLTQIFSYSVTKVVKFKKSIFMIGYVIEFHRQRPAFFYAIMYASELVTNSLLHTRYKMDKKLIYVKVRFT